MPAREIHKDVKRNTKKQLATFLNNWLSLAIVLIEKSQLASLSTPHNDISERKLLKNSLEQVETVFKVTPERPKQ